MLLRLVRQCSQAQESIRQAAFSARICSNTTQHKLGQKWTVFANALAFASFECYYNDKQSNEVLRLIALLFCLPR